jgi:hypothetical protein
MVPAVLNNGRTFANQAVFQTINVFDPRVFQKDTMLHHRRENPASVPYGSKWPDERILDLNVISDDYRPSDRAFDYLTAFSQANPSTHLACLVNLSQKLPLNPLV